MAAERAGQYAEQQSESSPYRAETTLAEMGGYSGIEHIDFFVLCRIRKGTDNRRDVAGVC